MPCFSLLWAKFWAECHSPPRNSPMKPLALFSAKWWTGLVRDSMSIFSVANVLEGANWPDYNDAGVIGSRPLLLIFRWNEMTSFFVNGCSLFWAFLHRVTRHWQLRFPFHLRLDRLRVLLSLTLHPNIQPHPLSSVLMKQEKCSWYTNYFFNLHGRYEGWSSLHTVQPQSAEAKLIFCLPPFFSRRRNTVYRLRFIRE